MAIMTNVDGTLAGDTLSPVMEGSSHRGKAG